MIRIVTILAIGMTLVAAGARADAADRSSVDQSSHYSQSSSENMNAPGTAGQYGSPMATRGGGQQEASVLKQHFLDAHAAYNNRDFQASAENLRQASDILRRESANARGDVADNLRGTAKDLDKLADKVQRGDERSWNPINDKIGDAYQNMADFNYQKARESYQRYRSSGQTTGRDVETGNALNAAAQNLEDWAAVTGRTLKSGTSATLSATRDLAGKMISGTGWATEKTGQAIDNFGNTIRDWGRDIRHPGEPVPPSESPTR